MSIPPKGMVADHWTWRDGKPFVTGWHRPKKRGKQQEEAPVSGRGVVRVSLFERMSKVQQLEPEPMPQSKPSARRLRELDAPKKPKRAKPEQGQLL